MKHYWNNNWEKNAKAHAEEGFTLSVLSTSIREGHIYEVHAQKKHLVYTSEVSEQLRMA